MLHWSGTDSRFTSVAADTPAELLPEIAEIVAHGGGLPLSQPSFTHSFLSDGSRLVARGGDGDGDVTAVRLAPGVVVPLLPIELWESPALGELRPGRRLNRVGLTVFARSRSAHLAAFVADVRALYESPDAPRVVVVEREESDAVQWIAIASSVLPREAAHGLTFASYTPSPGTAPQRLVGTSPDVDVDLLDGGLRVHDCARGLPGAGRTDPWAGVAAAVWLAGLPKLFALAARLPGEGPFDADRLAALAASRCVALDSVGRTAAARWAERHGEEHGAEFWGPLLVTLAEGDGDARSPEEWAAQARLAHQMALMTEHQATDQLKADLTKALTWVDAGEAELVRDLSALAEALKVPVPQSLRAAVAVTAVAVVAAPEEAGAGLVREMGAVPAGEPWSAPEAEPEPVVEPEPDADLADLADLMDLADEEDIPVRDLRVAPAPEAAPAPAPEAVPPAPPVVPLPASLFQNLPASVPFPIPLPTQAPPAEPEPEAGPETDSGSEAGAEPDSEPEPEPEPDPAADVRRFHALVGGAGPEAAGRAEVLTAAHRKVWGARPMRTDEARTLLHQVGPEWLVASGIDVDLIATATTAPVDDPQAPELAADLVRFVPRSLDSRRRAGLALLHLAGRMENGTADAGFTQEAVTLYRTAQPLEPVTALRARTALARALLDEGLPTGELEHLAFSAHADLIAAYAGAAREEPVGHRIADSPAYAAFCYLSWSMAPGLNALWEKTRTGLLEDVLRQAVREQESARIAREVEEAGGRGAAREFQEWHRPSRIARLFGR
ncbi:GTPase-associated protein 1-related protein [Streptomyces sp. NPDC050504]|uniref:GTPase-associated protein 1-related protein n=1 Tax=Streptomyces sp. NPDC050504 TaxID=3365618 RepID=UPI0037A1EDD1